MDINSYGHPSKELLEELLKLRVRTVSTNPCPDCDPVHPVSTKPISTCEIDRYLSDEEDITQSDRVDLTISSDGEVIPASADFSRKCEFCNSLALRTD